MDAADEAKLAEIEKLTRELSGDELLADSPPPQEPAPPPLPTTVSQEHSLLYTARESTLLRIEGEIMQRQLQIKALEGQHQQASAAFRDAQKVLEKEYGLQDGDSFDKLTGVIKRLI